MTERVVIRLSADWALGADDNQWIVLRARNRRDQTYWQPEAYVGSTKSTLLRVLRNKGAAVDAVGHQALAALPETFLQWRDSTRPGRAA